MYFILKIISFSEEVTESMNFHYTVSPFTIREWISLSVFVAKWA